MSLFSQDTLTRAAEQQKFFVPFAENMYNVVINDVKVVQVKGTNWDNGKPVRTEELVDNVEVTFIILSPADGTEVKDVNGDKANTNGIKFWFDPVKLGISKKGPSKARQFLCAAMALDINSELNLSMLENWIVNKELKDKELKCYISAITRDDGTSSNKIERFIKK